MLSLIHHSFLTAFVLVLGLTLTGCADEHSGPSPVKIAELPDLPEAKKSATLPRQKELPPREITLALVGEVRGEIEPCGCPTLPFGGFERRATLLNRLRSQGPGPLFHIDAGDTLVKGFSTKREDKVRTRALEILRLSEMVGVDAWVVGPSDLVALSPRDLQRQAGPSRVSATWTDETGALLLKPSIILERDGLRLGVIGLSAAPPAESGLLMKDPTTATQEALSALPDDLDMVIAVGSIADNKAQDIAASVTGLTAVFTTRGVVYEEPRVTESGTVIIETPDRGRYLQVLHARLGSTSDAPLSLSPSPPTWRARLAATRRGEPDKLEEDGRGRNLGLVSTIPLSADLDQKSEITDRLDRYRDARLVAASERAAESEPHEIRYASSGGCVSCHSNEFARWALTDHAKAWLALVKRGETKNPECVSCHTTAFGEPGGLGELTMPNIRKFKGVQCEMCHGPLAGHPSDSRTQAHAVTEQKCLTCHDEANSPDFDYETYLRRASCQGGAPALVPRPHQE